MENTARTTEVIQGVVALDQGTKEAGAIVWWRMSGDTQRADLVTAYIAAGLNEKEVWGDPGPASALRRSMHSLEEKRRLVRPLEKRGAWALVTENVKGEDISHTNLATVHLGDDDKPTMNPVIPDLLQPILDGFDYYSRTWTTDDVSSWLTHRVLHSCNAVTLRDTGGVYFVPRNLLDLWRRIVGALRSVSAHRVFEVPALASEEAVASILDAVEREATTAATAMEEDLVEAELGARALRNRAEKCAAVVRKVESYEALLGTKLDVLRDRLLTLQGQLAAAALVALAAKSDDE